MQYTNKGQKGVGLVSLGHGHIRAKRRVVIPSILLENVGLVEGDAVDFFLDTGAANGEMAIVIVKCQNLKKAENRTRKKTAKIQEQE